MEEYGNPPSGDPAFLPGYRIKLCSLSFREGRSICFFGCGREVDAGHEGRGKRRGEMENGRQESKKREKGMAGNKRRRGL